MTSQMEQALLDAPAKIPIFEWELEILRDILMGIIGTEAQRAAIIRILKQNRPKRALLHKLQMHLDPNSAQAVQTRLSYTTLAKSPRA